ncbi:MAG: hypothetical protein KA158_11790, partial [Leucobacter sp.]|nr:hypothetical protein [Leucobacter sp.]
MTVFGEELRIRGMGTSQDILGKRTRRAIAALGVALLVIGGIPATAALAEEPAAPPITVQDAGPEAPVPGPEAADDEQAPTPTVTIESLNPETQGVSKVFNYLVEFTCESTRLDCEEVEIDVPLIQTTPLAADAQPLSEWRASLSSSDEALVPSEPYWDSGKETRTIKLIAPLKPGVEVSVRIDLTPYRGRVANGTAWEIQPVIRASGAAEGVAPNPAKSSVTAVGALQHTTSTIGGGFRDEFRAGQTFDFNLRTSVVGVAPERDDVLYA